MKIKFLLFACLIALPLLAYTTVSFAENDNRLSKDEHQDTLVEAVRQATERYQSVEEAEEDGYALSFGCVSGPQEGAMGIHYVSGEKSADSILDPTQPEALIYESRDGKLELVGVEFFVLADAWHAENEGPPVLMGQLFHFAGSPNRYAIPAFYELHVWAWRGNPNGTFADWNPKVTCDEYTSETDANSTGH